jgi:hypothetical protein
MWCGLAAGQRQFGFCLVPVFGGPRSAAGRRQRLVRWPEAGPAEGLHLGIATDLV